MKASWSRGWENSPDPRSTDFFSICLVARFKEDGAIGFSGFELGLRHFIRSPYFQRARAAAYFSRSGKKRLSPGQYVIKSRVKRRRSRKGRVALYNCITGLSNLALAIKRFRPTGGVL